jgi:uncharacterized protein YjeT (DUF2065 family)
MATHSMLTPDLAIAIGVYVTAVGIGELVDPNRWRTMFTQIENSAAITQAVGFATFAVGTAIILVHTLWTDALAVAVTLIGWIALAEGVLMLAIPALLFRIFRPLLAGSLRPLAIVTILIGLLLLSAGLAGKFSLVQ